MILCSYCNHERPKIYEDSLLSVCCHCLVNIYNDNKQDIIFEICNPDIQKKENAYFSDFIKDKIGLWRYDPKTKIPLMCCKKCNMPVKNIRDHIGCSIDNCYHNIKNQILYLDSC